MIKSAGMMKDGRPVLLLGLSAENLRRLPDDRPIEIDTEDLRQVGADLPSMVIVLFAGTTEEQMLADLQKHLDVEVASGE